MSAHSTLRTLVLAASAIAAVAVSGCTTPEPPRPQPAFYADLAQPGAALDPVTASEIINAYRQRNGLAPMLWDGALQRLAEQEARALADRGDLSDGGGNAMLRALSTAGYAPQDIRRSVSGGYHSFADAFSGWRGSPGHDAVLRAREGKRYAIAAVARPGSRHRVYWVMLVSTR
jgi:uncharacterized protein YkwD